MKEFFVLFCSFFLNCDFFFFIFFFSCVVVVCLITYYVSDWELLYYCANRNNMWTFFLMKLFISYIIKNDKKQTVCISFIKDGKLENIKFIDFIKRFKQNVYPINEKIFAFLIDKINFTNVGYFFNKKIAVFRMLLVNANQHYKIYAFVVLSDTDPPHQNKKNYFFLFSCRNCHQ
ncbi:hypothetical protein RFI_12768 [Reticulomyxa filosa]|uniref:Uncharacterized protein n=1 Tax=Reticulomyxa filosa TaxID=46433 RepID=X6NET6_RETFI|nr:hypothetical protein RFI_12768 [Reticulomyxa filosa]|eukprot:ETO24388.1 hypothetical protein RFI_12768 [Reticulomyxa filosa]